MSAVLPLRIYLVACIIISPILSLKAQVNFTTGTLNGASVYHPTSLQFGPDGKLYVADQDGTIYRYSISKSGTTYTVSSTEVITLVKQMKNMRNKAWITNIITQRNTNLIEV